MAARGLFGTAPYSAYYRRGESSIRAPQFKPTPPRVPFLSASDPRPAIYQGRPTRDASDTFASNIQADISTLGVRRFFTTDIPVPAYRTAITMIRGSVGDPAAAFTTPPALLFFITDPPSTQTLDSDDRIFPPLFGSYDPLGSGAFFATPVPSRGRYPSADASDLFAAATPPGPTLAVSQRVLATLLSYQSPHRREGSTVILPLSADAVLVPPQRRRFLIHDGWTDRYPAADASQLVRSLPIDSVPVALPPQLIRFLTHYGWSDRYLADASALMPSQAPLPTLPTEHLIFAADALFYQAPHRQDASAFIVMPGGGVEPVELRRLILEAHIAWSDRYPAGDASLLLPGQPALLALEPQLRLFAALEPYLSPHRQEGSAMIVPPAGVASLVPLELRRFLTHEWARRVGANYAYDASWFQGPQSRIKIPPPPPDPHGRKQPMWLRRLEMLQLRPHVAEE